MGATLAPPPAVRPASRPAAPRPWPPGAARGAYRAQAVLALLLLAAYGLTRLLNLGLLPMVSDEGTYITWGVRALYARGAEDWLASLEDGKQPLLAWLMPPLLAALPDRLVAGRLVSVLCGLANCALLLHLGTRLVSRPVGWVAAALYVVAPVALVHDRMALYDSLVTTSALLVLWGALAWAERPGWWQTLALGLAMGVALLTKLSALFFLALVPVAVALWRPAALGRWWRLAQAYALGAAMYSVLYLSPIVDNIQDGNFQRYSFTAAEVLGLPWGVWRDNAGFILEAGAVYLGWPLLLAALGGLLLALRPPSRGLRVAALWSLVPLLLFVLTAKLIYSRYLVFPLAGLLIPAGAALVWLVATAERRAGPVVGRTVAVLLAVAVAVPGVRFAVPLLTDPAAAPWMNNRHYITDRFQYVESNYAGYGLPEIVATVRAAGAVRPVVVLVRDVTGMPRDGVTAYLLNTPGVAVGLVSEAVPLPAGLSRRPDEAYRLAARGADVYAVLTDAPGGEQERRFRRLNPGATLVLDLPKPGGHSRFQLYRVHWEAGGAPGQGDVFFDPPVRFGEGPAPELSLLGFNLSPATARPGESVALTLFWEAEARPGRDLTVFNHVIGPDGARWGQQDGPPGGGQTPTSRWRPGEAVADRHAITLPPDTPAGSYTLYSGLYEFRTLQRLPVRGGDDPERRVPLGRIVVLPADGPDGTPAEP